jgi:hypothetical protein
MFHTFVTKVKPTPTERQRHYISFINYLCATFYKLELDNDKPTRPFIYIICIYRQPMTNNI